MPVNESYADFPNGNWYDGYTQDSLLVRTSTADKGVGGKSPRDSKGRLKLRPNVYNVYKHTANFTPGKNSRYANIFRNGYYIYVEWTSYSYPQYWTNLSRHILPNQEPSPGNRAKMKFFDKILESKATMAQTFAERQQAIDMAADKVSRVFRAWSAVKKGKYHKARRALGLSSRNPRSKQASGQWLELVYGWLPLIGDVHTLLNFNPFAGDHIAASATESVVYTGWLGATVQSKTRIEIGAQVSVTDPMVGFANQAGLLNPMLVAWELMPFSFVIDWFLPVGNHLDYLTALCGLDVSDGYISTKNVRDIYMSKPSSSGLNISAHEETFSRSLFTKNSLGVPSLQFKNPISPMHIANAVALGRQLKG